MKTPDRIIKLKMVVELKYDVDMMHGEDSESIKWFCKDVLGKELILHSNEIGDEVGKVKVLQINKLTTD